MRSFVLLLLVCFFVFACKRAETYLSIDQMKKITWDLMKADEWSTQLGIKDSTSRIKKENIRLYNKIFALHHVTKDQFYKSFEYYQMHPPIMKTLLDSVDAFANRERERLFENHGQKKP